MVLRIIGLAVSSVSFVLGLVADLLLSVRLFRWKNDIALIAAPLEVVISILYWGISLVSIYNMRVSLNLPSFYKHSKN